MLVTCVELFQLHGERILENAYKYLADALRNARSSNSLSTPSRPSRMCTNWNYRRHDSQLVALNCQSRQTERAGRSGTPPWPRLYLGMRLIRYPGGLCVCAPCASNLVCCCWNRVFLCAIVFAVVVVVVVVVVAAGVFVLPATFITVPCPVIS